jgi:hypothetical protein
MIRYDYYEFERFQGAEPRWFDKFKSLKWVSCSLLILILLFVVVSRELGSIGNIKMQTLEMNFQNYF